MTSEKFVSQNLWNNKSKTYSFLDTSFFPAKVKYSLLNEYSDKDSICLDIGIANGIYAIPFAKKVGGIYGIDISEEMLRKCQVEITKKSLNNTFLQLGNAENIPFCDSIFDLVYSYATFGLIPNVDLAFSEICRVTKSGGHIIIELLGEKNLSSKYWEKYYKALGLFGINTFSLPKIFSIMREKDFQLSRLHSFGFLDQWKYIPILRKFSFLEKVIHAKIFSPDLDYSLSQIMPEFASKWVLVFQKDKIIQDKKSH